MKIACVVGARPNFMKIAPILDLTYRKNSAKPDEIGDEAYI